MLLGTFPKAFLNGMLTSGNFPTAQFPKWKLETFQLCNFPSGNFPTVQFPKSVLAVVALGPPSHPSHSAWPPLQLATHQKAKPNLWKFLLGKLPLGKAPLGKTLIPT